MQVWQQRWSQVVGVSGSSRLQLVAQPVATAASHPPAASGRRPPAAEPLLPPAAHTAGRTQWQGFVSWSWGAGLWHCCRRCRWRCCRRRHQVPGADTWLAAGARHAFEVSAWCCCRRRAQLPAHLAWRRDLAGRCVQCSAHCCHSGVEPRGRRRLAGSVTARRRRRRRSCVVRRCGDHPAAPVAPCQAHWRGRNVWVRPAGCLSSLRAPSKLAAPHPSARGCRAGYCEPSGCGAPASSSKVMVIEGCNPAPSRLPSLMHPQRLSIAPWRSPHLLQFAP